MKTLLTFVALAVPFAFLLAPLPLEIAASILFAIGLAAIAVFDYTHAAHVRVSAPTRRGAVRRHRARLGLAA